MLFQGHFTMKRRDGKRWWDFGVQWHQLGHMQIICTSLQTDNHTNSSSLNFYRLDALPDAQPAVSKHWRQMFLYIYCALLSPANVPSVLWRCWLGGREGIQSVKNWVMRCWHGYLSGARCRFAYGPADATASQNPIISCHLFSSL